MKVPLRDGVRLNATLYLPAQLGSPSPVVLTTTPYVCQASHDRGMYFAAHGYPFLAVDVRGRGNSEGTFRPFMNEAEDGFDVVEWLAQQPYCNGKVAMWGGSYSGYTQWSTAKQHAPHLATIVPVASPYAGADFPGRSHLPAPSLMQWLILVWGRALQDKLFWNNRRFWGERFRDLQASGSAFRDLDAHLGCPSPIFQEWIEHPDLDEYWDRRNPTAEQYAGMTLPILTITGYAWTMQGGPKPEFLQDKVAYYVTGAEKWRHAGDLKAVTARSIPYYLKSVGNATDVYASGSLGAEPEPSGDSEPDAYVYDPRDTGLTHLESTIDPWNRTDDSMVHAAAGKQLVYHSPPFAEDVEISGFFELTVWLSIDQPDTDFKAAVYEIDLYGRALQLSTDVLRARYRESLRDQKLIRTTAPLRYDFGNFAFISRQIGKGNRLRLTIGPVNSIYSQKNYNSGGIVAEESMKDARPVTVRLFHDSAHPSALHVPFGRP